MVREAAICAAWRLARRLIFVGSGPLAQRALCAAEGADPDPADWIRHAEKAASDDALRDNASHGEAAMPTALGGAGLSLLIALFGSVAVLLAEVGPPARPGCSSGRRSWLVCLCLPA